MMNTGIVALRWSVKRSLSVLIGCAILGSGHARGDGPDDAGRLVREAVHADLGGQREQRDAALARDGFSGVAEAVGTGREDWL